MIVTYFSKEKELRFLKIIIEVFKGLKFLK